MSRFDARIYIHRDRAKQGQHEDGDRYPVGPTHNRTRTDGTQQLKPRHRSDVASVGEKRFRPSGASEIIVAWPGR